MNGLDLFLMCSPPLYELRLVNVVAVFRPNGYPSRISGSPGMGTAL